MLRARRSHCSCHVTRRRNKASSAVIKPAATGVLERNTPSTLLAAVDAVAAACCSCTDTPPRSLPVRSLARDAAAGRVTMADGYGADVAAWLPYWLPYWLLRALFFAPSAPFCRPHHRPRGRRHCCTTRPCRERPAALSVPAAAGDDQPLCPSTFFARRHLVAGASHIIDATRATRDDV